METYIVFLRGINVGGKHKVAMKELKTLLKQNAYQNVITLLNSGNIIFDYDKASAEETQQQLNALLTDNFNFPIPTVIKTKEEIFHIIKESPFKNLVIHKDIKCYVSFLYEDLKENIVLENLEDESFKVIKVTSKEVFSVINLSKGKSTKAMEKMDKLFDKRITTRNWNTLERIYKKL